MDASVYELDHALYCDVSAVFSFYFRTASVRRVSFFCGNMRMVPGSSSDVNNVVVAYMFDCSTAFRVHARLINCHGK